MLTCDIFSKTSQLLTRRETIEWERHLLSACNIVEHGYKERVRAKKKFLISVIH